MYQPGMYLQSRYSHRLATTPLHKWLNASFILGVVSFSRWKRVRTRFCKLIARALYAKNPMISKGTQLPIKHYCYLCKTLLHFTKAIWSTAPTSFLKNIMVVRCTVSDVSRKLRHVPQGYYSDHFHDAQCAWDSFKLINNPFHMWCWLCKLSGFQVQGKWPGQTRPRVKSKKPALGEEIPESGSFGVGVPTGKLAL